MDIGLQTVQTSALVLVLVVCLRIGMLVLDCSIPLILRRTSIPI